MRALSRDERGERAFSDGERRQAGEATGSRDDRDGPRHQRIEFWRETAGHMRHLSPRSNETSGSAPAPGRRIIVGRGSGARPRRASVSRAGLREYCGGGRTRSAFRRHDSPDSRRRVERRRACFLRGPSEGAERVAHDVEVRKRRDASPGLRRKNRVGSRNG